MAFRPEPDFGDIPLPFEVGMNSSTMKTGGMGTPPIPMAPVASQMASPAPFPNPNVPPPAQNVPRGTPGSPQVSTQSIGLPEILANARGLGENLYGQYTPEKRNELYAMMAQRSNGMGPSVGGALASVGDAIARGYGRDQTNFLDKTLQSQKAGRDEALAAFDAGQAGTLAMTQSGLEIGKVDPSSALSKLTQEAFMGPLEKLGYSREQVAKMPASQIEAITQVALKYADVQSQKELKEATIQLQAMMNDASIKNQMIGRQMQATESINKMGTGKKIKEALFGESPETSFLRKVASGNENTGTPTAQVPGLAAGEVIRTTKDGKKAVFDEESRTFKRYMD